MKGVTQGFEGHFYLLLMRATRRWRRRRLFQTIKSVTHFVCFALMTAFLPFIFGFRGGWRGVGTRRSRSLGVEVKSPFCSITEPHLIHLLSNHFVNFISRNRRTKCYCSRDWWRFGFTPRSIPSSHQIWSLTAMFGWKRFPGVGWCFHCVHDYGRNSKSWW